MDKIIGTLNQIHELEVRHGSELIVCKGCEICDQIRDLGIRYEVLTEKERRKRKGNDIETPQEELEFTDLELETIKKNGLTRDRVRTRILKEGWDREKAIHTPITRMTPEQAEIYKSLAKENGIPMSTFYQRVQKGMTPQQAATKQKYGRRTG